MSPRDETVSPTPPPPYPIYLPPPLPFTISAGEFCLFVVGFGRGLPRGFPDTNLRWHFPRERKNIYIYTNFSLSQRRSLPPPPLYPFPLPPFILPIYSPSLYTDQQKYIFLTKIQAYIISTLFVLRRSIN